MAGNVRFERSFNRPTGLGPTDRVWLVTQDLPAEATVEINGQALASTTAATRLEITKCLEIHNKLAFVLPGHLLTRTSEDSPPGEVLLEIESP